MKYKKIIYSRKLAQIIGFTILFSFLAYGVLAKKSVPTDPSPKAPVLNTIGWQTSGMLRAKSSLSQNKILQGSDGIVYMKIDLEALDEGMVSSKTRVPTDFVVVLDRSGSMAVSHKMDYAKKAVESLLKQLNKDDRFSLVTFDTTIETPIPFTAVNSTNLTEVLSVLRGVEPRGSTDLGGGLQEGIRVLKVSNGSHARRLIMLSDGQANTGITSVTELGKIASQAVSGEFVISTIGVGLDFNEVLLSTIADYGTGSYYFLENLAGLENVLTKEFYGASRILASQLKLEMDLASDIHVLDASGYPMQNDGKKIFIMPGHVNEKQKRSFFVTLKFPTEAEYLKALGQVKLSYKIEDQAHEMILISPEVSVACLAPIRKQEVLASIDQDTFKTAWTNNNYGMLLKEESEYVRNGRLNEAKSVLKKYKEKLAEAYASSPSEELQNQISKVDDMENDITNAGTGTNLDEKQKRLSKGYHYKSGQEQRSSQ